MALDQDKGVHCSYAWRVGKYLTNIKLDSKMGKDLCIFEQHKITNVMYKQNELRFSLSPFHTHRIRERISL